MCTKARQRGLTLIELIVFILIVGVALAGILTVFSVTVRGSADPMIRKNMLSIGEAVLEEVEMQPFTWCDPDDAGASSATAYTDCTVAQNTAAGKTGESRGSSSTPLDNVLDYNGESIASAISGTAGTSVPAGYAASVSVAADSTLGPAGSKITDADAALLITVTVTHGSESLQVQGYRARYSPTVLP